MVSVQAQPLPWIAALVIALHAGLILWLSLITSVHPLQAPKPRVVVQTIQLTPKSSDKTAKQDKAPAFIQEEEIPVPIVQAEPEPIEFEKMPRLETTKVEAKTIEPIEIPKPKKEKIKAKADKAKAEPKKSAPAKKTAAKKKSAAPKKKTPPPETKKVEKPDPKIAAQKAKQQQLLAKAQESIGNIRPASVKIDPNQKGSELKIPQLTLAAIAAEPGETGWSAGEMSYRDELAGRLKLMLKLPEFGSVQLKMKLQRSGKVAQVTIIDAASQRNRAYVEKLLPTLQFPSFGTHFGHEPEHTFTITLNNDF